MKSKQHNKIEQYSNEDGELIGLVNMLEYDVTSKAQKEAYIEKLKQEAYRANARGKNWVACYHESIKSIMLKLELHELGAVLMLLPFMQFKKKGLLVKDGKSMNMKDIGIIIGKSRMQSYRIIKRLDDEGIITIGGTKRKPTFIVNKHYHAMGEGLKGMKFTKLYQLELRAKIGDLTIHEAGILYKVLPWFHYDKYYLCANPDEPEPSEINHLNHEELANLIGEEARTVNTHMYKLIRKGFVLKIIGLGGAVNYKINPNIMFRQDKESHYTELVRQEFQELQKTYDRELMNKELGFN